MELGERLGSQRQPHGLCHLAERPAAGGRTPFLRLIGRRCFHALRLVQSTRVWSPPQSSRVYRLDSGLGQTTGLNSDLPQLALPQPGFVYSSAGRIPPDANMALTSNDPLGERKGRLARSGCCTSNGQTLKDRPDGLAAVLLVSHLRPDHEPLKIPDGLTYILELGALLRLTYA